MHIERSDEILKQTPQIAQLQAENQRLQQLVAELLLRNQELRSKTKDTNTLPISKDVTP